MVAELEAFFIGLQILQLFDDVLDLDVVFILFDDPVTFLRSDLLDHPLHLLLHLFRLQNVLETGLLDFFAIDSFNLRQVLHELVFEVSMDTDWVSFQVDVCKLRQLLEVFNDLKTINLVVSSIEVHQVWKQLLDPSQRRQTHTLDVELR